MDFPFIKEAYSQKKWAFVADYIRLKVLFEHGGIYLDTDMMVLKSFNDLLNSNCFLGAEDLDYINCAIIGAEKNHGFIKTIMNYYSDLNFSKVSMNSITIPRITTKIFREQYSFHGVFSKNVKYNDILIYSSVFFYPLPYNDSKNINNYKDYVKKDSFVIHLWNSSWIEHSEFYYLRRGEYQKGFKIVSKNLFYHKNLNLPYIKKVMSCIKESFYMIF